MYRLHDEHLARYDPAVALHHLPGTTYTMRIRSIIVATTLASLSLTAPAAEPNSFDVFGRGNLKTATVTFTLDKPKDGLHARSVIHYVSAAAGTVIDDYKITPEGIFLTGTSTKRDAAQTTYTTLNSGDDKAGTLDGKPVTLHHFILKLKDNSLANLYTDSTGHLMQVEAPTLGVKQIRTAFALDK